VSCSIWVPESARKGTGGSKAILLWVYGGSHNTGTGEHAPRLPL
jgi:carboxylesterase type B